jgi:hypothetical protein
MEGRDPWLKWYPDEVLGHTGLRLCSLAARGLWQDCRAIMHRDGQPYGHLALKEGVPMSEKQLCARLNTLPKIVRSSFRELLEVNHVLEKTAQGVVFCPLLLQQAKKRELGRLYGGRGGNPMVTGLTRGLTPTVNPTEAGGLTQALTPTLNPSLARARLSLSSLDSGSSEGGSKGGAVGETLRRGDSETVSGGAHAARAQGDQARGGDSEIPTVEEVITRGAMQYGLSEEDCRMFFDHYNGLGWMVGQTRISHWPSFLSKWKKRGEATRAAGGTPGRPAFKNAAAEAEAAASEADIRAELEWQKDPQRIGVLRGLLKKRRSNV